MRLHYKIKLQKSYPGFYYQVGRRMVYWWCCIIAVDYLFSRSPIFSAAVYGEIINLEPSFCFWVGLCVPVIKPSKLECTIYLYLLFLGTQEQTECGKSGELKTPPHARTSLDDCYLLLCKFKENM